MEEPELRIGGWVQEKKRGKIRRVFSFLLVLLVGLLIGGPALVNYQEVSVGSGSLYLNAGVWNGPCLLYTSPSPRDVNRSRMPSSA